MSLCTYDKSTQMIVAVFESNLEKIHNHFSKIQGNASTQSIEAGRESGDEGLPTASLNTDC